MSTLQRRTDIAALGRLTSLNRNDPRIPEMRRAVRARTLTEQTTRAVTEADLTVEQRVDVTLPLVPTDDTDRAAYLAVLIERAAPEFREVWAKVSGWPPMSAATRTQVAQILRQGR